jgi:D-amino-acid dehydrogenase
MRVGLRPMSPDGLPILGKAPGVEGAYLATGHGSTGLAVGPYSAKLVTDLILDRPLEVDISPFASSRFRSHTKASDA